MSKFMVFTNGGYLRFTYGGNLGVWVLSCDSR